jgi:hypothetical protein
MDCTTQVPALLTPRTGCAPPLAVPCVRRKLGVESTIHVYLLMVGTREANHILNRTIKGGLCRDIPEGHGMDEKLVRANCIQAL